MTDFCEKLKEAIADERKGVEEYAKLIEESKKLPLSMGDEFTILRTFGALEEIKAQEEHHSLILEHIKAMLCK
jgi:hypothetical protein